MHVALLGWGANSAFKNVLEQATCDEEEARMKAIEAAERAEREERERRRKEIVAAEEAMVMAAAEKARAASERARGEDQMEEKASRAANVADASSPAGGAAEEKVQEAVTKRSLWSGVVCEFGLEMVAHVAESDAW